MVALALINAVNHYGGEASICAVPQPGGMAGEWSAPINVPGAPRPGDDPPSGTTAVVPTPA
jgi:hypothetical protein